MKVVVHQPAPPSPTYDLVGLSQHQLNILATYIGNAFASTYENVKSLDLDVIYQLLSAAGAVVYSARPRTFP
jgi:hypothetical protein